MGKRESKLHAFLEHVREQVRHDEGQVLGFGIYGGKFLNKFYYALLFNSNSAGAPNDLKFDRTPYDELISELMTIVNISVTHKKKLILAFFHAEVQGQKNTREKKWGHDKEQALSGIGNLQEQIRNICKELSVEKGQWSEYIDRSKYHFEELGISSKTGASDKIPIYTDIFADGEELDPASRKDILLVELCWLADHMDHIRYELNEGQQEITAPKMPNRAEPWKDAIAVRLFRFWLDELKRPPALGKDCSPPNEFVIFLIACFAILTGREEGADAIRNRMRNIMKREKDRH